MNGSLRIRLLIGIAVMTVAGFTVAAIVIFTLMRSSLLSEFDALLGSKARALATLVEQRGDAFEIEFADHPMQEFARQIQPEYYQVWDEEEQVLAKSRRLEQSNLILAGGSLAAPGYQFVTLPDGRPGRQVAVQFLPAVEGENLKHRPEDRGKDLDDDELDKFDFSRRRKITLVAARATTEIDQAITRLSWTLFIVSALVVVSTLLALAWLVKRSLSPLEDLATQISKLDEHDLASRFQVNNAPSELVPVVTHLNQLLTRLEAAFQRERVFSSNVAHELRTPLAGLRSTLDVALSRNRSNADYRESLEDCAAISSETQKLVETLLSLSRIESGQEAIDCSFVDLETLLMQSWQSYEADAAKRAMSVSFVGPPAVLLKTDADKLRIVFSNIYSNAVEYGEQTGTLETAWVVEEAGLRLTIENSGCELSEEQALQVFDQFWRADTARAATGSHAGLGLALCKKIIHLLGGTIVARCECDNFAININFPAELIESQFATGEPEAPELQKSIGI